MHEISTVQNYSCSPFTSTKRYMLVQFHFPTKITCTEPLQMWQNKLAEPTANDSLCTKILWVWPIPVLPVQQEYTLLLDHCVHMICFQSLSFSIYAIAEELWYKRSSYESHWFWGRGVNAPPLNHTWISECGVKLLWALSQWAIYHIFFGAHLCIPGNTFSRRLKKKSSKFWIPFTFAFSFYTDYKMN